MIQRIERKSGTRFVVYGRAKGKQVTVGTFHSERDAKSAERRHVVTQEQIEAGELPPEVDTTRTLKQATEEWLTSLKNRKSRSHKGYSERMRMYVLPKLGDVPIARLNKAHVMQWRDEMATRLAPASVNGTLVCLSSAFTYFVDRQWLAANQIRGIARIEAPDRVYTWVQTKEEITKLLLECPKGIREIATLAIGTGMRLDELLHLHHADISIERRLITVHRGGQGSTKSGKARRVPILDSLLPFVRELALNRDGATLVFPGDQGKPRTKPGVREPFKQAVSRAGLPKELRFHDLRHSFASHWVLDGGDIFRLSKILGHSSVVVTQKTYAHLIPDAWEQDYHRVAFVLPEQGAVYGLSKRRALRAV
jgi:integrase